MIKIVQIGQFYVDLYPSSMGNETYDTSIKFRRAADTLTHVPGDVSHSDPCLPLVDAGDWKMEGSLICTEVGNDGCENVFSEFQRLLSVSGAPTKIIGVVDVPECYCTNCKACTSCDNKGCCLGCGGVKFAQWMTSCVEITDVKRKFDWKHGQRPPMDHVQVSLTLKGHVYWEPMDYIHWKFWYKNLPRYTMTTGGTGTPVKQYPPRRMPRHPQSTSGFQYLDYRALGQTSVLMNPDYWYLAYHSENPRLAIAEVANGLYAQGGRYSFSAPLETFPAPPKSLYYFTNFSTDGDGFTIRVEATTPTLCRCISEASLSMADLDANLENAGYEGIAAGDAMIVGQTPQGPTVYLRLSASGLDYEILDVYVPWQYDSTYIGQTYAGSNRVSIDGPIWYSEPVLDPLTGEILEPAVALGSYSWLHIFRSY